MVESMKKVMEPPTGGRSEVSRLQGIREAMDTQASRRQEATHGRLREAHEQIYRVFNDVQKYVRESTAINLNTVQHGYKGVRDTKRTLSWIRPGSEETVLSVTFDVREAGDEIVIDLSGEPMYRTSLASPSYEGRFDEAMREECLLGFMKRSPIRNSLPRSIGNWQGALEKRTLLCWDAEVDCSRRARGFARLSGCRAEGRRVRRGRLRCAEPGGCTETVIQKSDIEREEQILSAAVCVDSLVSVVPTSSV